MFRVLFLFWYVYFFTGSNNCVNAQIPNQTSDDILKISETLFKCLKSGDTSCVKNMFLDKNELGKKQGEIAGDCKIINSLFKSRNKEDKISFKVSITEFGGRNVYAELISRPDTLLNIKSCLLVVYFISEKLSFKDEKFITYQIFIEKIKKSKNKIIQAPEIVVPKSD